MTYYCAAMNCKKKTNLHCKRCKLVYYCSDVHQQQAWGNKDPLLGSHKQVCRRMNKAIDGYRLCDLILKCNDDVNIYLSGKAHDKVEVNEETMEVTIYSETLHEDRLRMVNSPAVYLQGSEDVVMGLRAYWALRSFISVFGLNCCLVYILQSYKRKGCE